jgi:hypothetical protein
MTMRVVVPARQVGNRFLGLLKGLEIRALCIFLLMEIALFNLEKYFSIANNYITAVWRHTSRVAFLLLKYYELHSLFPAL